MLIKIDGIVELPEGMTEDYFNRAFLEFMESHELEFGGGTKVVEDEEDSLEKDATTLKLLNQYKQIDEIGDLQKSSLVSINVLYQSLSQESKIFIKNDWPGILSIVEVVNHD